MGKIIRIALFCGGRGSASLIREILRIPDVELNLLVNAYDNGMSTGEMRKYIPGYLGPSDFRKNLSYLLELHSPEQYILSKLIDYRMPVDFDEKSVNDFISFIRNPDERGKIPADLENQLQSVSGELKKSLYEYLISFFAYYLKNKDNLFNFSDCSLGNLLFAGAFLKNGNNFEKATEELMTVFQSKTNAGLLNVTNGENRFLVALKENGEFLDDEAKIVAKQSAGKFFNIYLIPEQLTKEELKAINGLDFDGKRKFLESRDREVTLSGSANSAIKNCDIIIFGPGTQFSSLLPSYKTKGIGEAIKTSDAKVKLFIVNINKDHDIQSYTAEDLIDIALNYLGDKNNNGLITHAFFNGKSNFRENGVKLRKDILSGGVKYNNTEILTGDYEHPVYSGIHSGAKTIKAVLDLYESERKISTNEIDIYVDLNERSLAVRSLIEEFLEIDWSKYFKTTGIYINNVKLPELKLPSYMEIHATKNQDYFSEVAVFSDWFWNKNSRYLVTISGDGEYRVSDIVNSINILNNTAFGTVYGSRNQSRQQFTSSINAAYGESKFLFYLSRIGAIFVGILCALRFRFFFSDPLTGFRVYSRKILKEHLRLKPGKILKTSMELTRCIIKSKIEMAEFPVQYKTFKGFTNVKWRFFRGLRNLIGIFL